MLWSEYSLAEINYCKNVWLSDQHTLIDPFHPKSTVNVNTVEVQNLNPSSFDNLGFRSPLSKSVLSEFHATSSVVLLPLSGPGKKSQIRLEITHDYLRGPGRRNFKSSTIDPVMTPLDKEFNSRNYGSSSRKLNYYHLLVAEVIRTVLQQYDNRRHWPISFQEKLMLDAFQYAQRSTYFTVREATKISPWEDGNLIGNLKLVSANDDQMLPIEVALNVRLDANGGRKFEPSNFFIEKGEDSQAIFVELMAKLKNHAKHLLTDPNHEVDKPVYFTYADKISKKMYHQLGFTVTKGFETPILFEGKEWFVMSASAETMARIDQVILAHREYFSTDQAKQLIERQEKIAHDEGQPPKVQNYLFLDIFRNHESQVSVDQISVSVSTKLEKQVDKDGELSAVTYRELIIEGSDSHIKEKIAIDIKHLPLTNGSFKTNNGQQYFYHNGLLTIVSSSSIGPKVITLSIDAYFNNLKTINIEIGRPQLYNYISVFAFSGDKFANRNELPIRFKPESQIPTQFQQGNQ